MPEPRIKRYALVSNAGDDGIRRFHLARVASASRSPRGARRLERMEDVAALDRHTEQPPPGAAPPAA
jgi:hypothetical protein